VPVSRLSTVEKAFRVLTAVAEGPPRGATALGRELALDKNAVQRILVTLEHLGWIRAQAPPATGWTLTSQAMVLGRQYGAGLRERAHPYLQKLADITEETAQLWLIDRGRFVIVDAVDSQRPLRIVVPIGYDASLDAGQQFLAFLDPGQRAAHADAYRMDARTAEKVRAQGYYITRSPVPGATGVGAPVLRDGAATGAVLVVGPTSRMRSDVLTKYSAAVIETAQRISEIS
jgi:IclR family transcriptional regulator, acetate operon repressor